MLSFRFRFFLSSIFLIWESYYESLDGRNTVDRSRATEKWFGTRMSDFGVFPCMDIDRKMAGPE